MKSIKVLGPGCQKCRELYEMTVKAVNETGVECNIEKIEDIRNIISYNILSTPALIVDDKVRCAGKLPSIDFIKQIIMEKGGDNNEE